MRIHVVTPKPSTVSVDEDLMALLGAALVLERPSLHADAKAQIAQARAFVRQVAERTGHDVNEGLSRVVQRAIFRRIAEPRALAVFDARDTEEAKANAEAAHLEECAKNGWLTPAQLAEKRLLKARKAEWRNRRKARLTMVTRTVQG